MIQKIALAIVFLFFGAATGAWIFSGVEKKIEKSVSHAQPAPAIWKNQPPQPAPRPPAQPQPGTEVKPASFKAPKESELLILPKHSFQTFNNCGPTTLSMMLSYYGAEKTPAQLGKLMRPYQNQQGDNDDKSTSTEEFVEWAKKFGLSGVVRPGGNIDTLKIFLANGFPVVVRTKLRPNKDTSHYRIIRGFDEKKKVVIQDDSYFGKNIEIKYADFYSLWQPFNYEYFVLYPKGQEMLVFGILGQDSDEQKAFEKSIKIASGELLKDATAIYPRFNISTSYFHLGKYIESAAEFELVESRLPAHMLWYQYEPIQAYLKLKDRKRVLSLIDKVLNSGNRAFSELYFIRGELYLEEGNASAAKKEFELAVKYKENYEPAITALEKIK